jgi:hypothetical protein
MSYIMKMLLLALVAMLSFAGHAQACLEYDLVWDPKTQLSSMSLKDGGREVCGFNNWYIGKSLPPSIPSIQF